MEAIEGQMAATFRDPAAKQFDWEHIMKHHSEWGAVAKQRIAAAGKNADSIFWNMTENQIKACVKGAWKNRKRIDVQGTADGVVTAIKYRGVDPGTKKVIGFWYDVASKKVTTAYGPAGL